MSYTDYEERIDSGQGNYIVAGSREFESVLERIPLMIAGLTIAPGELTTLHNWFISPVQYCGMKDNGAIFYLGEGNSDLFQAAPHYYDVTYIIEKDRSRIGKSYKAGSFRDSFWTGKKWK